MISYFKVSAFSFSCFCYFARETVSAHEKCLQAYCTTMTTHINLRCLWYMISVGKHIKHNIYQIENLEEMYESIKVVYHWSSYSV